jgi:hypothetical protein
MGDTRNDKGKLPPRWPADASATPTSRDSPDTPAGRIVHDERGNAVWNWLKETGRFCIDSTSAMLKRLDVSDLSIDGAKDEQLRGDDAGGRDEGGGYDPYNQKVPVKKGKPAARK